MMEAGQATRSDTSLPSKNAITFSTTFMPMAIRISSVALQRCGGTMTVSIRPGASGFAS
ncbi:hypothetical protein HFO33_09605 [Rhizobium leguminosarum]|nr:hypothetical protein [Rhizobium leguminosarum]